MILEKKILNRLFIMFGWMITLSLLQISNKSSMKKDNNFKHVNMFQYL